MTDSFDELDSLLERTQPIDLSIPAAVLREWRVELVRASVTVSYAIGVLSLDIDVLNRIRTSKDSDVLNGLIEDLPKILASGWVGGGWSLANDASASVGAAAELEENYAENLLELHAELAQSDLANPSILSDLIVRVEQQRESLSERRRQLETRIRQIQDVIRQQYATGTASIEDWLE